METPYEGSGMHSAANLEILRLVQAHKALLPTEVHEGKLWAIGRGLMDAVNLKPSFMGMSIDLKQLFTRQKNRNYLLPLQRVSIEQARRTRSRSQEGT